VFGLRHLRLSTLCHGRPASRASASERAKVTKVATSPKTLELLQSFSAPMLSRNPVLHYVFSRMGMAEERGLGLKSLKLRATQVGLPLPGFTWEAPYLILTLYRSTVSAERTLARETLASLSKAERSGWQWLATKDTITSAEYTAAMEVPNRTALNHLKRFTRLGLLQRTGSGPATQYKVIRQ